MKNNVRIVVFAILLGIVCSVLLVGTNMFTTPYRRANEQAEEIRNFLSALEVPVEQEAEAGDLLELFDREIKVKNLGSLEVYEYIPSSAQDSRPVAVAIPFSGSGLWGPIKGVVALEPDLITIRGIRFYQQEETPGLGGEIGSQWFQDQFKGKQLMSSDREPGFRIVEPGGRGDVNAVDGITGATMTSDRVESILNKLAQQVGKERENYVR